MVPKGLVESSVNTMKLHIFGCPTKVGYAIRRPTILLGAVCGPLDLLLLSTPHLFPPPLHLPPRTPFYETVGNLLKHGLIGPSTLAYPPGKNELREGAVELLAFERYSNI